MSNIKCNNILEKIVSTSLDFYENIYNHPKFNGKIEGDCSKREIIILEYIKKYEELVWKKY